MGACGGWWGWQEARGWVTRGVAVEARGFPMAEARGGILRPDPAETGDADAAAGGGAGGPGGEWEWTVPEGAEGAQVRPAPRGGGGGGVKGRAAVRPVDEARGRVGGCGRRPAGRGAGAACGARDCGRDRGLAESSVTDPKAL